MAGSQSATPRLLGLPLVRAKEQTLLLWLAAAALIVIGLSLPAYPQLTEFRAEAFRNLPNVVAPLIVLALFIERAVEVVLAAWRHRERSIREERYRSALEGRPVSEQWEARSALAEYKVGTQRLAFGTGFVIAALISMMGVRAIEMLVGPSLVFGAPDPQRSLFVWVDILVTALLLTGGAEGIHKVVTTFTTFMDMTRDNLRGPAAPAANGERVKGWSTAASPLPEQPATSRDADSGRQ